MTSKLDPSALAADLNHWYGIHGRDLLWRHPDTSPWGILVSEVMSQQTPVRRVEPLWRKWMERWPTPADLAEAPTADVLRQWANLGYPRRALRLQECARACVEKHHGDIPSSVMELEALPGVGSYTARAVAAFAFGQAVPVVDTNVRRVYKRLVKGDFLQGPARARDLRDVAELLPYADWDPSFSRRHPELPKLSPGPQGDPSLKESANVMCAALMELGATVCTATNPACGDCPVAPRCEWIARGRPTPTEEEQLAAKKRVQKFAGTDRQVRGKIMAQLRERDTVSAVDLTNIWEDQVQLERCIESLLLDKLIVRVKAKSNVMFHLPR